MSTYCSDLMPMTIGDRRDGLLFDHLIAQESAILQVVNRASSRVLEPEAEHATRPLQLDMRSRWISTLSRLSEPLLDA